MLPRLSLFYVPWVLWAAASAPSQLHAQVQQQSFPERYALATDRAAVLKDLVPGTDDYYFYHALYHQTQGRREEAAVFLKEWETKLPDNNARREILKNRSELLGYDKAPAATLAWLQRKLSLEFNHQRQTEEARAELSSALDPALISFAAFEQHAIGGTDDLQQVTAAGLYRLSQPVEKWKITEIRALLNRLTRPDFPSLVDIIDRELNEKDARFGNYRIHTLLTSEQLAELQKRRPALLDNEIFTSNVLSRLRPLDIEDPDRDPAVRRAWLERLWSYASTLHANANPLKANLLYHLLDLDLKQGRFDEQRLLAYLRLPRPVSYINPRYQEDRTVWKFPARLDFDPSAFTGTRPVTSDEALVRRLVIQYLTTAENADALAPLVNDVWLREALAEAKLVSGAPEPQRWVSLLPAEAYQSLRDRTDIEFDAASPGTWAPTDVVKLDVWLKNVPSVLVRIYEVNMANVHLTGQEVNTGLDLDGLTANTEHKLDYTTAPILRHKETFTFPELSAPRGVWIIEFVGNGKASRALVRKGGLRTVVRQTSAGTAVTVLDEKLQPVPTAFAMVGPKQFPAGEKGVIALPLSEKPGPQQIIINDGHGFTALETIELQGEKYELSAGFHVPRESLLPGNNATLLVQPSLKSNHLTVLLDSLEKAKLTLTSTTLDGTPSTAVFSVEKFEPGREATFDFAVPERLQTLSMTLSGEVKSTLTGAPVQVNASSMIEVNTLTASGVVSDLHFSRSADAWVLQELGLNGEPRAGREVNVTFRRAEFEKAIEVLMKTNASGTITLGTLDGITSITASQADGLTRTFKLPEDRNTMTDVIHAAAGESLFIPWSGRNAPGPGEASLFEQRGGVNVRRIPPPGEVVAGYLIWKGLPAGTYRLYLPGGENTVRISAGEIVDGYSLTPASTLQLTRNRPVTINGFQEGNAKRPDGKIDSVLVVHVAGVTSETRVHVFASRFVPEFDAMQSLGSAEPVEPSAVRPSWNPSVYLSTRNIGDEYRYVLERRRATRFAGNMVSRPGLLLNPWQIAETETKKELLEEMEKAQSGGLLPKPAQPITDPRGSDKADPVPDGAKAGEGIAPPPSADLSFLANPGPVALNLKPDANGNVVITRALLGDRQFMRVVVVDRESSAVRDFSFGTAALPPRDLRLARQLDPAKHFSQQNRVTLLQKDAPFRFDDALAAQFQAVGHLGSVHQLFLNLTQNTQLAEFSWLLEWPSFAQEKKRQLYSQYACHELNFFLSRKDPEFFKSVVQPYLASKRDKTFLDEYLTGTDLAGHLAPWPYAQLNTLERLLLAQRLPAERAVARRSAQDWLDTQAPDPLRDMFLFETALRGRALIAESGDATVRYGLNMNHNWDFQTAEGAILSANDYAPAPKAWYRQERSGAPKDGYSGIVELEYIKRQERVRQANDVEQDGDRFFGGQDFARAIESYRNALNTTPSGLANQPDRQRLIDKFARSSVILARQLGKRGEFEKAKNLLGEVLSGTVSPGYEDASELLKQLDDPERFDSATTRRPEIAGSDEVKRLFNKGLSYYDLGQFTEAEAEFERILAIDPYNAAARRQLERAQREVSGNLKSARDETRLRMLDMTDNLWVAEAGRADLAAGPGNTEGRSKLLTVTDLASPEEAPTNVRKGKDFRGYTYGYTRLADGDFDNGVVPVPEERFLVEFEAGRAQGMHRLFRQQEHTKTWAEQNYFRLPIEAQNANLVPVNRFWRDYAVWDGKTGFISINIAYAAGTFSEMMLAMAVLDLPFPVQFKAGKADTKDNVLTLTPAAPAVLFHQDILPAEPDKDGAPLLVSQNFYREGDRYTEEGGEKTDKFVSAEFLTGTVYGCQVVVTNPSSSRQRLDVLFQIPAGAMPVKATRRVQSQPVMLEAYRTTTLEFHFYFPQPGKFSHFPVHVSRTNAKTAASAAAFTFNVVPRPTINDPASWDYVSQHGTNAEVLSFLEQHNLYFLDLEQILWRLKDADFFRRVVAQLKERHVFDEGVWSYAALHNLQPFLTEFIEGTELNAACGPVFDSPVLTVNPVEQQTYQHLEYSPLINARAHALGGAHAIMNDRFRAQWESLMTVLAFRSAPSAEDWLAIAAYLAAQDRIEEALEAFARVNRAAVAEKLQYEYLRAWLAMCQEDTVTARRIAGVVNGGRPPGKEVNGKKESETLPPHWRDKFAALAAQLDELDGKPSTVPDMADRDAVQNTLADRDPSLELTVDGKVVKVKYRHVSEVTVSYYPVDLEFLFSANPFITTGLPRFGNVRPAASEKHMLPANGDLFNVALPARFHSQAVLVEISGGGTTKSVPVYAHALDVQMSEPQGQVTVKQGGKPLPKVYVKVFADVNGRAAFYKDGYTDLRGKFDYASLSTDDLDGARRFSVLIQSEAHGAVVREAKPPVR